MQQPNNIEQSASKTKVNLVITPLVWALIPEWSTAKTINQYFLHIAFLCFLFKIQKEREVVYIERQEISEDASSESKQTTKT